MIKEGYGYAAVDTDACTVFVHTTSPSRRAAMVSYLIAEAKIMVLNTAKDEDIEAAFNHVAEPRSHAVVPIKVVSSL